MNTVNATSWAEVAGSPFQVPVRCRPGALDRLGDRPVCELPSGAWAMASPRWSGTLARSIVRC